jgi:hypothetical protein
VLGALLFVVVVLYTSCGGSGGSRAGQQKAAATATPSGGQSSGSLAPTPTIVVPSNLSTSEPAEPDPTLPAAPDPEPQPPPANGASCTNDEMTLTPVPAKTSVQRGTPVDLRLRIANSSSRTCERDVGADLQELRLVQGAQTIWSSDHCGAARGSDLRTFGPGGSREYMVTWNGKSSSKCTSGVPAGPLPDVGEYQLVARLGTKLSAPVKVTLR